MTFATACIKCGKFIFDLKSGASQICVSCAQESPLEFVSSDFGKDQSLELGDILMGSKKEKMTVVSIEHNFNRGETYFGLRKIEELKGE